MYYQYCLHSLNNNKKPLNQCFETRPGPAVEPVDLVTKTNPVWVLRNTQYLETYKNPQKTTKTWNPIPVEPINNFCFFNYVLYSKFPIKKLGFSFSVLYL